ncbi:MAG: hypothetical protein U9Q81_18555 [Pseudomonadota bacterium]|nr:hypothetical protein [Pseudomonadota bacterium]
MVISTHSDRYGGANLCQQGKKAAVVIVGEEDRAPINTAQNDMHRDPGGTKARSSWHEAVLKDVLVQ